ncbi:aminotransferase class I/II-fold pyridoxal phosphate-dependent enzyme [Companilactobacillus heilongjiangensis]|uniref:aminotransferase class I/II-fold pyridoxal phosphate-dependent enzyme n=1 Tax=Companilactobacillus heilongjiangensis TaxID=1074467 RepID=UPI0009EB32A8|nr:aminotransferase class I/II-fold pyridoxal phosphate-dependent enzyme [Companilactobacillus heilongjiangensis]
MIVCNPHNPSGHIWDKATLTKIGQMAKQHNVLIISDEIHGDLTMPGHDYVPFASLDSDVTDNSISLVSPSKTFNVAILHAATMIIPNEQLRQRATRAVSVDGINEPGIWQSMPQLQLILKVTNGFMNCVNISKVIVNIWKNLFKIISPKSKLSQLNQPIWHGSIVDN